VNIVECLSLRLAAINLELKNVPPVRINCRRY
jgi:hypothetical protein